jgi:hypothetical protein
VVIGLLLEVKSPMSGKWTDVDVTGSVRVWDAVGADMNLKTETKVISGRINDIAWDGESQRIIAVGDGKERYGHAFTFDSGNTVGEAGPYSTLK